jgi:hypothetical protein
VKFVFEKTGLQKISPACQHKNFKNLSFFGVRASSRLQALAAAEAARASLCFQDFGVNPFTKNLASVST